MEPQSLGNAFTIHLRLIDFYSLCLSCFGSSSDHGMTQHLCFSLPYGNYLIFRFNTSGGNKVCMACGIEKISQNCGHSLFSS